MGEYEYKKKYKYISQKETAESIRRSCSRLRSYLGTAVGIIGIRRCRTGTGCSRMSRIEKVRIGGTSGSPASTKEEGSRTSSNGDRVSAMKNFQENSGSAMYFR